MALLPANATLLATRTPLRPSLLALLLRRPAQ
jgi:hypothetical protein